MSSNLLDDVAKRLFVLNARFLETNTYDHLLVLQTIVRWEAAPWGGLRAYQFRCLHSWLRVYPMRSKLSLQSRRHLHPQDNLVNFLKRSEYSPASKNAWLNFNGITQHSRLTLFSNPQKNVANIQNALTNKVANILQPSVEVFAIARLRALCWIQRNSLIVKDVICSQSAFVERRYACIR